MKKPTKTISGVAPVAVMVPPRPCVHGTCLFCPTLNAPQSYTPESPAVLRAKSLDYDPYKQTKTRIKMLKEMGHPVDKIELIIMGGTFLSFSKEFQFEFVKRCYDAMNNKKSKTLEEAKKLNETAKYRCVALCMETRPDVCSKEKIKDMLEFGATRVELGVQAIDNKIYKLVNRGHSVKDVVNATKRLKQSGFKVGYHLMPGIYGSNPRKDIRMFKKIFSNSKFKPDQIKIYPCQVLKGSKLEEIYWKGKYAPYQKPVVAKLIIQMLKLTPRYCRIMRILREIPLDYLICGIKHIDMRKDIEEEIRKNKIKINEIRFREIGFALRDGRKVDTSLKLKTTKYKSSDGTEYFLEIINQEEILFGLLRLRFEKNNPTATIRELHVYGPALKLGEEGKLFSQGDDPKGPQHSGLGKQLLMKAEEITMNNSKKKIRIISGVGVRAYYKKFGYKVDKKGIYVEKELD
jgi:elongator complex protein 3